MLALGLDIKDDVFLVLSFNNLLRMGEGEPVRGHCCSWILYVTATRPVLILLAVIIV